MFKVKTNINKSNTYHSNSIYYDYNPGYYKNAIPPRTSGFKLDSMPVLNGFA